MNKGTRNLICSALLLVSLAAGSTSTTQGPAPGFSLPSRSGEAVSLEQYQDQVVMINFWASWCAPCREEMPLLEQIYQRYESLGFTLLGVNVDENPDDALAFLNSTDAVSFPILFDTDSQVSQLYDVVAMPSTVVLDRSGNVRFIHHGYQAGYEDEYQAQVRQLIRER